MTITKTTEEIEIGRKMKDGTIYAGISPETGESMYVMPQDASATLQWKTAMQYAAELDAHGHDDWKIPTIGELKVLFENRSKIGGFDKSKGHTDKWYWSSEQAAASEDFALIQSFDEKNHETCDDPENWDERIYDNSVFPVYKEYAVSVRPVRSGPAPS